MVGDHLTVRHVENGFYLELNGYVLEKGMKRVFLVAKTEEELYEEIAKLFPVASLPNLSV